MQTLFLFPVALGTGKSSKKKKMAEVCNSTSLEPLCHQPSRHNPEDGFIPPVGRDLVVVAV